MITLTAPHHQLLAEALEVVIKTSRGTDAFTGRRLDDDAHIARKVDALALMEHLTTHDTLDANQAALAREVVADHLANTRKAAASRAGQPLGALMAQMADTLSDLLTALGR